MAEIFYTSGLVALAASLMVVTRRNAAHAALYLIVSLLAVATAFFAIGAPFVAAMEVIVYAGAIMVLFVFVIMMLDLGRSGVRRESAWLAPRAWIGPGLLALVLAVELAWALLRGAPAAALGTSEVEPREVARALFGPYVIGVELASFLLLAALVGAYHLGFARREPGDGGEEEPR